VIEVPGADHVFGGREAEALAACEEFLARLAAG
jgi:hypothetical protein